MAAVAVPDWCRWRGSTRPLLLIAPHGGSADTSTARALETKVNDVHTAELTWELAEELDAAAIVNPWLDRNLLDLNRISQVERDAPWFPMLIERLLAPLLDAHPMVELLFIHGWNVIQPKCDIGVGAHFETEGEAAALKHLTVDTRYIAQRLAMLRHRCRAAGIHTMYGERYPASHRNNLLQLFRRDGTRSCDVAPRLRAWAANGRLNAVQLELGVPLRWPGPLRAAFTRTLRDTFAASGAAAAADLHLDELVPAARAREDDDQDAAMLLAFDPRAGIGFMSGISPQPNGQRGGRLLVFSASQTMALFTGEDPIQRGYVVGGPRLSTTESTMQLSFVGPLLEVQDAAAYLRLEHAFMQSRLVDADVALSFEALYGDHYGRVRGSACLNGTQYSIDTFGFRNVPIFLRRPAGGARRCAVAAAFGNDLGLHAATVDDETVSWRVHDARRRTPQQAATRIEETLAPAACVPARLTLRSDQHALEVKPVNHMQIHRPLPDGGGELVLLGLAHCALDSRADGYGLYEYVRRAAPSSVPPLRAATTR